MGVTIKATAELELNDSPVKYLTFQTFKKMEIPLYKIELLNNRTCNFLKWKLTQSLQTLLKLLLSVLSLVHLIKWKYIFCGWEIFLCLGLILYLYLNTWGTFFYLLFAINMSFLNPLLLQQVVLVNSTAATCTHICSVCFVKMAEYNSKSLIDAVCHKHDS